MTFSNRKTSALFFWAVITLAVLGLAHTVFGNDGVLQWFQLREEVTRLQAQNERLAAENERLKQETERLVSDPQYIERTIRRDLGYVRPDEVVFRFGDAATEPSSEPGRDDGADNGDGQTAATREAL